MMMRSAIRGWIRRVLLGDDPRDAMLLRVRAIRGAIDVPRDDAEAIHAAVTELVAALVKQNALGTDRIISAIFTTTPDITSMFPALAARDAGWNAVPLLCATELAVPGALPLCVRVLVHAELPVTQVVRHVYLGGAAVLRPDLVGRSSAGQSADTGGETRPDFTLPGSRSPLRARTAPAPMD